MYLPRPLISTLYLHLQKTHHALSAPVLILVALEPDALCGCRILTHLLKRDYIPHKIQPIAGYGDLEKAGREAVRPMMESEGGSGGVVVCLGVGGLVDLGGIIGLEDDNDGSYGGVDVWVIDARRPWNLGNVFGGAPALPSAEGEDLPRQIAGVDGGKIGRGYKGGKGGVVVFDDGDIDEELGKEREAYLALVEMPEIDDDGESDGSESEDEDDDDVGLPSSRSNKKRKSWSDRDEEDSEEEDDDRPRQRRRSNSSSPIPESPSRRRRGLISVNGPDAFIFSDDRSVSPTPAQPPKQPSARTLRRRLLRLRRKHEAVLRAYYSLGASYSEPISSMMYSLASELGREDNDLLWLTIVGVSSMELYGRSAAGVAVSSRSIATQPTGWLGSRGARIRQILRDEVRRLNVEDQSQVNGIIPTTARSPTDTSIRLSPEPKFLLIRHWSLYDSMLHSPYLSSRLHIWSETGRKRLHKLLAKMGVSLVQCKQSYTHMDMDVKKDLRAKLLKYRELYGLDDLVPGSETDAGSGNKEGWGFVRSWGWRATLSAQDVGVVVGSILEVGKKGVATIENNGWDRGKEVEISDEEGIKESEEWVGRFWNAYDALENIEELKAALPTAQHLYRAILRTGTSLIEKRQIRHLRAFRMCLVKEGPDVPLFTHPAALTKLALWIGEAIAEQERESKGKIGNGGRGTPLVVAGLNETRGVYVVVGMGGGGGGAGFADPAALKARREKKEKKEKLKEERKAAKVKIREQKRAARREIAGNDEDDEESEEETESEGSDSESESEDEGEKERGYGRNKFGNAFQEVVEETSARVRIDSFEHCVVEVRKEDLVGFFESLSSKAVVG